MLLSDCIDDYINKNKQFLKERTIKNYSERKKSIIKEFGNIDIENITQDFIQDYINKKQEQGKKKSAISNIIILLKVSLKPYKSFTKFRYIKTEEDCNEKQIYSEEDINIIENYIIQHDLIRYMPIMIAINTGMRLGEILGLKWKDVDLQNREIYICRNIWFDNSRLVESLPKTKDSIRQIPINDKLFNYLKNKACEDKNCFVITNTNKTRTQRSVQRTNQVLCEKAGVRKCGMHAYRHAFATKLLSVSQDFKSISQIMGHSTIEITQNIYNHPSKKQKKDVIASAFGCKENSSINKELTPKENNQCQIINQVNYQPQIEFLQRQINSLNVIVSKLSQFIQDNVKVKKKKNKFKLLSVYGNNKFFTSRIDLQNELDIDYKTLKAHLNGEETILDELGIEIQEL